MKPRPIKGSEYWRGQRRRYAAIGFGLIAVALTFYVVFVIVGLQIGQAALIYLGAALCFASLLASAVMAGLGRYAAQRLREEEFYEQHQPDKQADITNYNSPPKEDDK